MILSQKLSIVRSCLRLETKNAELYTKMAKRPDITKQQELILKSKAQQSWSSVEELSSTLNNLKELKASYKLDEQRTRLDHLFLE
jgi:hypothetical protein